jgi:thioredoxin reductase (NADPH)
MYDIIIIGAGPAGMTAALYGARAGMNILLLEASVSGGQVVTTPEIENYPAMDSVAGWDLAQRMSEQIGKLGVKISTGDVSGISENADGTKTVATSSGSFDGRTVVIANGAKRRKIGCPGETELQGRGVSYCAVCDGGFFRGKTVAVFGGGNSAIEDALYLAEICKKVYIINRRSVFRALGIYVDAARGKSSVEFLPPAVISAIRGDGKVTGIDVSPTDGGAPYSLDVDGVFVSIGLAPDNAPFAPLLALDESGYIKAGETCETSVAGIYAAGDTRTKPLRQIVTAMADGAVAASRAADRVRASK